jgi:release factor glutamine methyltransferase
VLLLHNLMREGAERLGTGPHPQRARADAELLLLSVLGKNKAWLMAHGAEEVTAARAASYNELVTQRLAGEPIQYILGEAEFYGLPFRVTRDVLIPRPETEHLMERALELAAAFAEPRIVDIGTGSGAIAVALADQLPSAAVTAIDISAPALAVARENALRNGAARIRFLEGDLLAPVNGESFELVVSNPPYVPAADRASLSVEVREFEPELALFAGSDGLDIYRRLIPAAFAALPPGGFLLLEIGFGQSAQITHLLARSGFAQIEFVADLQGIARVACARRP